MSETAEYLKLFARFPFTLSKFPRERMTREHAVTIVQERLDRRNERFLELVQLAVYAQPTSPYLALLNSVRCEWGDLCNLVADKGLEGALLHLREQGVYITFEEFKGRKPIVRNGLHLAVTAADFDNPIVERDFTIKSGGSTGTANSVGISLDHIVERLPYELLSLDAYGVLGARAGLWSYMLPSSAPWRRMLTLESFGRPVDKWYCPSGLTDSKSWLKYNLATFYIMGWLRLQGFQAPGPEFVPPDQAVIIARWIRDVLDQDSRALMYSGVSRTLRICVAAHEHKIDLTGAVFRGGGEPVTRAKLNLIERVGARFRPTYAISETNYVGTSCDNPSEAGDLHLLDDAFSLFTYPYDVPQLGITVPAFNFTTLLRTVPKFALNVQMDDYGILEQRSCGCPLEHHGYTTHIREIRSYSKLVGEGVTLIGSEMLRLLEETLPNHFGGTPLDYQLVEYEESDGFTRVNLLISPRLNVPDEPEVLRVFYNALRESSPQSDAARAVWERNQTIRVRRQEPIPNSRGKIQPMRLQQPPPNETRPNSVS